MGRLELGRVKFNFPERSLAALIFLSKSLTIGVGLRVPKVPVHSKQTRAGDMWPAGTPAARVFGNAPTVTLLGPKIVVCQRYTQPHLHLRMRQEFQSEA